jgi:hypothetical protein
MEWKKLEIFFFENFTWGDIFAPTHKKNADGPLVPVRKQPGLKGAFSRAYLVPVAQPGLMAFANQD